MAVPLPFEFLLDKPFETHRQGGTFVQRIRNFVGNCRENSPLSDGNLPKLDQQHHPIGFAGTFARRQRLRIDDMDRKGSGPQ
jgi:hypothetical protein